MADVPQPARAFYNTLARLRRRGQSLATQAWGEVSPAYLSESWVRVGPQLVSALSAIQVEAATAGSEYGAATLAAQGSWVAPEGFVDAAAFGGWSSSGARLSEPLRSPIIDVKAAIGNGVGVAPAMQRGLGSLVSLVGLQVSDAGRGGAGVDTAMRQGVGYVRMLNPPSCDRCTVLAGRFYRWNAGFRRHPHCFPAGVLVSGPESEAATRRWYEGELVTLATSSGQNLSLTGNHPVLTSRGWVPANLLQEGDEVVRSTRPEGATPLVVPDHHQVPALIEDVWRALRVNGLDRVPSTAEDFHGDGQDGQVDVVRANSPLGGRSEAALAQHLGEHLLAGRVMSAAALNVEGVADLLDLWDSAHPSGAVRGSSLQLPLRIGEVLVADLPRVAHAATRNLGFSEHAGDGAARHSVLLGEGVLAGSSEVLLDDLVGGEVAPLPRWDAPGLAFDVQTADGYAARGRDLLNRLAGQVEIDRVIEVRSTQWSGHVYSLTSSEGWHVANSLIVSNCDCVHVQTRASGTQAARDEGLIDDPYEYFHSLSEAEQDRVFGKGYARSIRDGGDIYQVVNSKRGRVGAFTTEGTTRRGYASSVLRSRQRRMTPDTIYRLNPKREDAIAALRQQGYILPGGQVPGGSLRGQVEGFGALGRGGTRIGASRAVEQARATGVRDPNVRYTMTEAERRLFDASARYEQVLAGRNPFSKDGTGLTPSIAATVETDYRRWLASGGQIYP